MKVEAAKPEALSRRIIHGLSRALGSGIAYFGSVFFHAYESTVDILPLGVDRWNEYHRQGRRVLAVFWHGQGLIPLAFLQGHGLCLYASWGREGAAPTLVQRVLRDTALAIVGRLGFPVMDASRLASEARGVIQFLRLIQRSRGAVLAPDGPSGPPERAKPGAAYIASKARVVIMPVGAAMRTGAYLDGWDHFAIPRPFSQAAVAFGAGIEVPEAASDEDLERITRAIESGLEQATRAAQDLLRQSRRSTAITISPLTANSAITRTG